MIFAIGRALLEPAPPAFDGCLPPLAPLVAEGLLEQIHLPSLLIGVCVGILAGPVIDLLWLVRRRWRRFVVERLEENAPRRVPLHKVLA